MKPYFFSNPKKRAGIYLVDLLCELTAIVFSLPHKCKYQQHAYYPNYP